MTKLKGLLLTEGMHGMISQVEGLAKALDLDFIHEKIEINNFWKLFPPKVTPIQDFVFKNKINSQFDVVISCGRKSVIPSIYLKKKFKILGSAHNLRELKIKELQNIEEVFLSPLFKEKTNQQLNIYRYLKLKKIIKMRDISLGGINNKNLKKLKMIRPFGFAGISYFE